MAKLIALYRSQFGSFDSHGLIASWQNCLNSGIYPRTAVRTNLGKVSAAVSGPNTSVRTTDLFGMMQFALGAKSSLL